MPESVFDLFTRSAPAHIGFYYDVISRFAGIVAENNCSRSGRVNLLVGDIGVFSDNV